MKITYKYLLIECFPKSGSLIHGHHDWKVVILPTELPINYEVRQNYCKAKI